MNISPIQSPGCGLRIASLGTCFVGVAHLARVCLGVPIQIGSFAVPLWMSGVAFIALGALSCWFWKLSFAPALLEPPKPKAA